MLTSFAKLGPLLNLRLLTSKQLHFLMRVEHSTGGNVSVKAMRFFRSKCRGALIHFGVRVHLMKMG